MNILTLVYIISISLQVSGALLLMLSSLSTKRVNVIKKFISKNTITKEGPKIFYDEDEFKETFRTSYLNIFSFGFIAFGYLIGVFGEIDCCNRWGIILGIILFTAIFMSLSYLIVNAIIKRSKKVNTELSVEELEKNNIEPNDDFATNEDIDKIFTDD